MQYGTSKLKVPAVIELEVQADAAASAPTSIRELMETLNIVPIKLEMLWGNSQPESCHTKLVCEKLLFPKKLVSLQPDADPNSSATMKPMATKPLCCYPCIEPPDLITR